LLDYDVNHLRQRFELASTLPRARTIGARVAEHLAALPRTLIHGEFYASNVLFDRDAATTRVRAVDWETCGIGPGALDLAALTAGSWNESERCRIERAYVDACPPHLRPAKDDLDHARLLLAAQWVGWASEWRPPAEHAHDWRREALTLIEKLGL
ncbi:MAG: phosphotransferase, partial [Chloroflexota bacterium]|nr:phosphotransferase [Chloroflexota bacterium]